MISKKKLVVGVLCLISSQAMASVCNYKSVPGDVYEFGQVSPFNAYQNTKNGKPSDAYSHFFKLDKTTPLRVDKFYARNFTVLKKPFEIVQRQNKDSVFKTHNVRYYEAIADNCDQFLIEVDERSASFAKYFNVENHRLDGVFPMQLEQNALESIHLASITKAESHIGKNVFFLNYETDKDFPLKLLKDQSQVTNAKNLARYKVIGIDYQAFDLNGDYLSEFGVIVQEPSGEAYRAPFIKDRVAWSDPTRSKGVREKYVSHIKDGQLAYGMNAKEITLAWGVPKYVKYEKVYSNPLNHTEFVKNKDWPYGGTQNDFPVDYEVYSGKIQRWYYPSKLLDGEFLKLDQKGILQKNMQHENTHKNVIEPRKIAKPL